MQDAVASVEMFPVPRSLSCRRTSPNLDAFRFISIFWGCNTNIVRRVPVTQIAYRFVDR